MAARGSPSAPSGSRPALPLAKAEGLEVHAWMWTMICPQDARDSRSSGLVQRQREGRIRARQARVRRLLQVPRSGAAGSARVHSRHGQRARGDSRRHRACISTTSGIPDAILPSGLWSKYGIVQDKVYPPYDYGYTDVQPPALQSEARHRSDRADGSRSPTTSGCSTGSTASSIS